MKDARQASLPLLEQKCGLCGGCGRHECEKCPNCNGSGYAPTDAGKKLRDFIVHQFSEIVEEVADGRPQCRP
jgi:hypothetical protein